MNKRIILIILGIFLIPTSIFALSNESLVGYYTFEQASSPYTSYNTINSNSLSAASDPAQVAGILGFGAQYDGAATCTYGTHSDYTNLADSLSLNVWIKGTLEGQSYASFVYRGTWGNPGALGLRSQSPGNPGIVVFEQASLSSNSIETSTTTLNDDNWHMITAVLDSGNRYIYVDGVLETQNTYTGSNPTYAGIFSVGCRNNADRYFSGVIDELAIFKTALDATNVTYLYNSGAPGTGQQPPFIPAIPSANNGTNNIIGAPTNFIYNLTYDPTSKIINYNWTDIQQTMTKAILEIRYFGNGSYVLNQTLTNTTQTAGNIPANVTTLVNSNYTVRAIAYLEDANRTFLSGNTTLVNQLWIYPQPIINYTTYTIDQPEGVFWGMGILMTMILMAAYNPPVAIMLGVSGLWFISLFGFIELATSTLFTITLMAAILIWGMKRR